MDETKTLSTEKSFLAAITNLEVRIGWRPLRSDWREISSNDTSKWVLVGKVTAAADQEANSYRIVRIHY